MLMKFLVSLIVSIGLIATWVVTTILIPVDPHSYLTLRAPLWHVVLQAAWLVSLLATNTLGVYLYWEIRSRRRHQTDQQPQ